jgi:SAM-dependent methyltransferase
MEGIENVQVPTEELADVTRYLAKRQEINLEQMEDRHQSLMRCLETVRSVTPDMRMLEVGTGLGLFPIRCTLRGLNCTGLEISPTLIAHAKALAGDYGADINIILGNLEDHSMAPEQFDVIVAASLFEHVEDWRRGLERIYQWLRPGGLLLFESTNKFALRSGEYAKFPFYGWLPNAVRYRFRQMVHGPDIMQLGIDFHQFTQGGLRKVFREVGFSRIHDRVDLADLAASTRMKRRLLAGARRSTLVRRLLLTFMDVSLFVCEK